MKKNLINRYCTISEMSKYLRVSKHTILHYEEMKLISAIRRGKNNYRYYSGEQIERFKYILYLRELGFSINDIKECLESQKKTKIFINKTLDDIDLQIQELLSKKEKLKKFYKQTEFLEKQEKSLEIPHFKEFDEILGVYTDQNSTSLENNINSFGKFDALLNEATWSEKYLFGIIINKNDIIQNNYSPSKFVVKKDIENYEKKYIFLKGTYAILYASIKRPDDVLIKKLLNFIREKNYTIIGDLFIQFNSANDFFNSNDDTSGVKSLKILIKKS